MEATGGVVPNQGQQPPPPAAGEAAVQTAPKAERLNAALQQQLNLESVKTRAIGLYKAISRILEDFDAYARSNTSPKWYRRFPQTAISLSTSSPTTETFALSSFPYYYPRIPF